MNESLRIYVDPNSSEKMTITTYKGRDEFDEGFFYAPYVPFGGPLPIVFKAEHCAPSSLEGWWVVHFAEPTNLLNNWDLELMNWIEDHAQGAWFQSLSKNYADGTYYHSVEFALREDALLAMVRWA